MKRILASSERFEYQLGVFFANNPDEEFVIVAFDGTPAGRALTQAYGKYVVHKSGRATFGKEPPGELAAGIVAGMNGPWYGIVKNW